MKTLDEIAQILRSHKIQFHDRYRVKEMGIFGSYARQEQTHTSDVDVLIDYEQPPTLPLLVELQEELNTLLEMDVDLVTKNGLKSRIRDRVLAEVIYL